MTLFIDRRIPRNPYCPGAHQLHETQSAASSLFPSSTQPTREQAVPAGGRSVSQPWVWLVGRSRGCLLMLAKWSTAYSEPVVGPRAHHEGSKGQLCLTSWPPSSDDFRLPLLSYCAQGREQVGMLCSLNGLFRMILLAGLAGLNSGMRTGRRGGQKPSGKVIRMDH